ncbi:MAG: Vgb family protein [Ktedonobacteraceae bacterium]
MKRCTHLAFLLLLTFLIAACGDSFTSTSSNAGPVDSPTVHSQPKTTPSLMASGTFHEYSLPQSNSGLMRPAIDHEGRIWFGEMGHNLLSDFDPHTQKFQQITPPSGRSGIMGVVVADDDSIWFAEQYANYIGHYFPASGRFQSFPLPTLVVPDQGVPGKTLTLPSAPNDLVFDKQGNIWFTELNANAVGRLNMHNGQIQQYSLTKTKTSQSLNPYGITIDPQGNIWFTEASANHIGRLNPKTGQISYFSMQGSSTPLMEIAADPHGIIWTTSFSTGLLLSFNPKTTTFTSYYAPSSGGIYGITITPGGQVWITITAGNVIANLDPTANRFIDYAIPSSGSLPLGVVLGANNSVWFTEAGSNKIGMLKP